jgi:hypothetical protein
VLVGVHMRNDALESGLLMIGEHNFPKDLGLD